MDKSEANRLVFMCNYIFLPHEYQLDALVLKAASQYVDF